VLDGDRCGPPAHLNSQPRARPKRRFAIAAFQFCFGISASRLCHRPFVAKLYLSFAAQFRISLIDVEHPPKDACLSHNRSGASPTTTFYYPENPKNNVLLPRISLIDLEPSPKDVPLVLIDLEHPPNNNVLLPRKPEQHRLTT